MPLPSEQTTLTAALYLFSALLQADATLLGLGAIFVIFRRQSIHNAAEAAINRIAAHQSGYMTSILNSILRSGGPIQSRKILTDNIENLKSVEKYFNAVVLEQEQPIRLRKLMTISMSWLIIHMVGCSAFLAYAPQMNFLEKPAEGLPKVAFILFAVGVVFTGGLIWQMISDEPIPDRK